ELLDLLRRKPPERIVVSLDRDNRCNCFETIDHLEPTDIARMNDCVHAAEQWSDGFIVEAVGIGDDADSQDFLQRHAAWNEESILAAVQVAGNDEPEKKVRANQSTRL